MDLPAAAALLNALVAPTEDFPVSARAGDFSFYAPPGWVRTYNAHGTILLGGASDRLAAGLYRVRAAGRYRCRPGDNLQNQVGQTLG